MQLTADIISDDDMSDEIYLAEPEREATSRRAYV
jgi:hypothetical protein